MSDAPEKPKLTEDQAALVYEGVLNRTILLHLAIMASWIALALVIYVYVKPTWLAMALVVATIFAANVGMRCVVLAAKCPSCGAPVLARIHSIVQVRSVKRCPECEIRLRG